ncbi:unnamed protein product [Darwinula stevensoni]|uniref:Uncharacterized protein n=1 Tax=Darwinula stevensoni TaxID=69355 RepID=A0A7R9A2G4_9CRUS|nr:unnamed protein product [Darwinula stevensoni]CAG0889658.1 unnamed protein product [Darwinula stevensoni]
MKVVNAIHPSEPARESTWLYQAENFIKNTYPDWESDSMIRLVPPVEDKDEWIRTAKSPGAKSERVLILSLYTYVAPVYATPAYTARLTAQRLNFLTEDKLDILVNCPRKFVFKGAAGTGKTWLLQEKIRNIIMSWFSQGSIQDKDEKILFLCKSPYPAENLEHTISDLLLTSAMAVLKKWIDRTGENEERKSVQRILENNFFICCLYPLQARHRLEVPDCKWGKGKYESAPRAVKAKESDEPRGVNLRRRMRNVSWEIVLCYELLRISVAALQPEEKGRWALIIWIIERLFQSFSPSADALKFMGGSIALMDLKENKKFLALKDKWPAIYSSMSGISDHEPIQYHERLTELPPKIQHTVLGDLYKILKTKMLTKMTFHHIFVDEAEDLCSYYDDHWSTLFSSVVKGSGGYFWQAYDPIPLRKLPDT